MRSRNRRGNFRFLILDFGFPFFCCVLLDAAILLLNDCAIAADAAAGEILAGVAKETFSLPQHVPLAGYSRRKGKASEGVHDPVGVRALVLRDGPTTVALASCDLLIVDERLYQAVRRRLLADGLPRDVVLLLAATHTHSGPGAYGTRFFEKISMGHFDATVFEAIAGHIARAISAAYKTRSPVRVAFHSSVTNE